MTPPCMIHGYLTRLATTSAAKREARAENWRIHGRSVSTLRHLIPASGLILTAPAGVIIRPVPDRNRSGRRDLPHT